MLPIVKFVGVLVCWGVGVVTVVGGLLLLLGTLASVTSFGAAVLVVLCLFGIICLGVAFAASRRLPRN
jgi:Zn-dependent membrane protease YugP